MRKTYIATTQEAKALHDGTQTAIISKMRVQPKDCSHIHRQTDEDCPWRNEPQKLNVGHFDNAVCSYCGYGIGGDGSFMFPIPYVIGQEVVVREVWVSANMPVSAARTRFIPVSCEAVRVRDDIGHSNAVRLLEFDYSEGQQFKNYDKDWSRYDNSQFQFGDYRDSWKSYIIHKLGQSAWDNNDYVFYYKIEKI